MLYYIKFPERIPIMKRNLKLALIGTIPLWVGIVINSILSVASMPIFIVSAFFMGCWCFIAYKSAIGWEYLLPQALWLNLVGLIMFALVVIQELTGSYWVNYLGMASQLYFIPGLAFVSVLIGRMMETIVILPLYAAEMVFLFLFSLLGCWLKSKKRG